VHSWPPFPPLSHCGSAQPRLPSPPVALPCLACLPVICTIIDYHSPLELLGLGLSTCSRYTLTLQTLLKLISLWHRHPSSTLWFPFQWVTSSIVNMILLIITEPTKRHTISNYPDFCACSRLHRPIPRNPVHGTNETDWLHSTWLSYSQQWSRKTRSMHKQTRQKQQTCNM